MTVMARQECAPADARLAAPSRRAFHQDMGQLDGVDDRIVSMDIACHDVHEGDGRWRNPVGRVQQMPSPSMPSPIDYDGAWIGGIVPALLGDRSVDWLPGPVLGAGSVVLLVLDGLGWGSARTHRARMPTLSGMTGHVISAAVPSTTATGLTSITTGLPAAQHGITGYSMRVGGQVMSTLGWRMVGGASAPAPEAVQPHKAFSGHRIPVVTKADFRRTSFSRAHLGSGPFLGWQTPAVLVQHVRHLISDGADLVYAYYDGVDKVAHAHGLDNDFYLSELAEVDRLVGQLLKALPQRTALLVTADHGQVEVPDEGKVTLEVVARMVSAYAGEARVRGLFARAGASGDLLRACQEAYGHLAWVIARDELFDGGWFGPGSSPTVRSRCGDVVLIAREPVAFLAPNFPMEAELRSMHGSLSPAEMQVPLLAARGTAVR